MNKLTSKLVAKKYFEYKSFKSLVSSQVSSTISFSVTAIYSKTITSHKYLWDLHISSMNIFENSFQFLSAMMILQNFTGEKL